MSLFPQKPVSLSQLIKGCIKGKRVAQKQLYNLYSPKMFGVCRRYSKDYHEAEDLLQEGFIKVFNNIHKFRGDGSFEGWVRRIFVNTAIEHYRKGNQLYLINENIISYVEVEDNNAISKLAVDDIMKLVNGLSPGYRTVFNLFAIEGYSHKEIASMLGISEGTSKSQLARARFVLKEALIKQQETIYESVKQTS